MVNFIKKILLLTQRYIISNNINKKSLELTSDFFTRGDGRKRSQITFLFLILHYTY
jgi:hypothetical protein